MGFFLRFKRFALFLMMFIFSATVLISCTPREQSTALGTGLGAAIGASISKNKWKGAVIGGAIGAAAGAAFSQIQQQAVNQAVDKQKPVIYRRNTNNGWQQVEAAPASQQYYNPQTHTKCQKIHIKIINNGRLVKDRIKEVCKGTKETNEY